MTRRTGARFGALESRYGFLKNSFLSLETELSTSPFSFRRNVELAEHGARARGDNACRELMAFSFLERGRDTRIIG